MHSLRRFIYFQLIHFVSVQFNSSLQFESQFLPKVFNYSWIAGLSKCCAERFKSTALIKLKNYYLRDTTLLLPGRNHSILYNHQLNKGLITRISQGVTLPFFYTERRCRDEECKTHFLWGNCFIRHDTMLKMSEKRLRWKTPHHDHYSIVLLIQLHTNASTNYVLNLPLIYFITTFVLKKGRYI